ncbi:MAG: hypothetical protein ABSH03_04660 [Candidatus Lustribacter sp.]|jgi:hypothetical protein
MLTTNEALGVLGSGHNPYTHVYALTNPPGGLFGYPPGEIAFYGLAHLLGANVFRVDMLAGVLGLGLLASLAPLIGDGLAALALSPLAAAVDVVFHSTDGSNDTAASFLTLAGIAPLIPALTLFAFGGAAVALWRRPAPSLGAAFLGGCALVALIFVVARWTSSVYYIFLTPLVMAGVTFTLAGEREGQTPQQA